MDIRSLWLNFEVSLFIFNRDLTSQIRDLQMNYIRESNPISLTEWRQRPVTRRFAENAVHLLAPIL
jgi:cardiolipin synthase